MDEMFVRTFNMMNKIVGLKNKEEIEVDCGCKYNQKEGTTFVAKAPFIRERKNPFIRHCKRENDENWKEILFARHWW